MGARLTFAFESRSDAIQTPSFHPCCSSHWWRTPSSTASNLPVAVTFSCEHGVAAECWKWRSSTMASDSVAPASDGTGVGLANVRRQLAARYDSQGAADTRGARAARCQRDHDFHPAASDHGRLIVIRRAVAAA